MVNEAPRAADPEAPGITRITARDVTDSTTSETALARVGAIERQEHAADVARMRAVLVVALPMWIACGAVDWTVVRFVEPGDVWYFWTIRGLIAIVITIALARLMRAPDPSPSMLRFLDVAVYSGATAAIAAMSLRYLGIASPYGAAISCVVVGRGIALPTRWQRGLVLMAIPTLMYPLIVLAAALASPRIEAQFHDPISATIFAHSIVLQLVTYVLLVAGGHAFWRIRRQFFESRVVGRYRLKHLLGSGGMGEVWVGYHPALKRDVAVKILRPGQADTAAVARFEREVSATADLEHPNTVRVLDCGVTADGIWFYAMELLDGETLGAVVARQRGVPAARAVHFLTQASRAIAEAHRRGIVHRDIKPENVFVTSLGGEPDFVKVLDFGIAKLFADGARSETLTRAGAVLGTPLYMAPEQGAGEDVDARSDVYALGAVLYFALTGAPPFDGKSTPAILMAHMRDAVVPPSMRTKRVVPRDLDDIVARCLAKSPADRYPSAAELADALAACSLAGQWSPISDDVAPSSVGDASHEDAKTIAGTPPRGESTG